MSRHGKLKTRSVPACAEFNQDERVLPEHKLEVKHFMARVKAIIDQQAFYRAWKHYHNPLS